MAEAPSVTELARRQPFVQLILLAAVGAVTLGVSVIDVGLVTPAYVGSVLVIAALAGIAIALSRWDYFEVHPGRTVWIAVIPVLDILAYTFIRSSAVSALPAVGVLVIFPMAWLAFAFPLPALATGVAATLVVTGYGLVVSGGGVKSVGDLVRLLGLPVLILLFAVSTHLVALDLARRQREAQSVAQRAREAERSSVESALTIEALSETTADALVILAADGHPVLMNAAAQALGVRAGRADLLQNEGPAEVYEQDRITPVVVGSSAIRDALRAPECAERRVWVGAPGDQVAISALARPVIGPEGEVIAVIVVGHDVTALVEAIEVRDTFLDSVGHELKTPLTVILGQAGLLAGDPNPSVSGAAASIEAAAERLAGVVNQLIAAGRARVAGAPTVPADRVAVEALVRRSSVEGERAAAQKGVDFGIVVEQPVGSVNFVPRELDSVLRAVIRNAVAATPPGGSVVVGARRDGGELVIDVSDTGIGLADEEVRQVFDRFYRTRAAREGAVPGLGLGLTVARAQAEANGAVLGIASEPGRGTVVTLRIPAP